MKHFFQRFCISKLIECYIYENNVYNKYSKSYMNTLMPINFRRKNHCLLNNIKIFGSSWLNAGRNFQMSLSCT